MCIGMPMQVIETDSAGHAWCEADGHRERLDMALVGAQSPGTWVLAFQGAARQLMSPLEAARARAGRQALAAVLASERDVDAFFADLIGREPQLPPHLAPAAPAAPNPAQEMA
jgi:hydrogenase expression/formation protein HypC